MPDILVNRLLEWYSKAKRDLPWRHTSDPYKIWVSEIMLQQTRVEAVIGYYDRFLRELPSLNDLAVCPEEKLLKLWEGLGYYSRVRNMKKAAEAICAEEDRAFPSEISSIRRLPGIGSYTAGAIGSIAFSIPEPAVDGNVLRVAARVAGSRQNILEPSFKRETENRIREILEQCAASDASFRPGDLNQALIELGAIVCIPNGRPHCKDCPLKSACRAAAEESFGEIPVRIKKTKRKIEQRTVLLIRDGELTAVRKRPDSGLLAGLYEFPNYSGHMSEEEIFAAVRSEGYEPLRIRMLPRAKHLFSHVEWQMTGFEVRIASEEPSKGGLIFADTDEIRSVYPIASAFSAYAEEIALKLGKKRREK